MEVKGTLKAKFDTQIVSGRFKKREFVLITEANTTYPQQVSFQINQDKCDILDRFNEGQELEVHFNLRGREWSGPQGVKYFNTLEAWMIKLVSAAPSDAPSHNNTQNSDKPVFTSNPSDNDDLPFN